MIRASGDRKEVRLLMRVVWQVLMSMSLLTYDWRLIDP